jgi:ribosomal protein L31
VKKGIHPEYKDAVIKCACGAEVKTKSTSGDMHVDICSKCHPFFTGKQKFVDAGGRLDKFKKRLEAAGK